MVVSVERTSRTRSEKTKEIDHRVRKGENATMSKYSYTCKKEISEYVSLPCHCGAVNPTGFEKAFDAVNHSTNTIWQKLQLQRLIQ